MESVSYKDYASFINEYRSTQEAENIYGYLDDYCYYKIKSARIDDDKISYKEIQRITKLSDLPDTRWISYMICEFCKDNDIEVLIDYALLGFHDLYIEKNFYKQVFMNNVWNDVHYGTVHIETVDSIYRRLIGIYPRMGVEELYLDYLEKLQFKIVGYNSSLKSLYSYKELFRLYRNGDTDALSAICEKISDVVKRAVSCYYEYFNNRALAGENDLYQSIMLEIIELITNYEEKSAELAFWSLYSDYTYQFTKYKKEFDFDVLVTGKVYRGDGEIPHINHMLANTIKKKIGESLWSTNIGLVKNDRTQQYLRSVYKYMYNVLPEIELIKGCLTKSQEIEEFVKWYDDCKISTAEQYFSEYYFLTHIESLEYFMEKNDIGVYEIVSLSGDDSKKIELIEDEAVFKIYKDTLMKAIDTLNERQKRVLALKFGLEDYRERTLEEVGQSFGVGRGRIGQILKKAIHDIKHSRNFYLIDY
ncbi:RNA polymerase sigma factor [Anaerovibrio sp. JC8]|uniref:sigma factor-like helix-turn-helix DNA-binding protein n=1 Tax=Anaerovibrio sp. JC8 TaxID=1240085 RepID=UPI000A09FA5C|nr:sigma factor-like helix-turn-helix DNA-binding protein [Anaerovibrio sp. JC8]ORT99940.1 RNA polymerase sigma factor [Anaerovibrio sp. JC8]